ncbi:MAG TPA: phosphatase PAP2 family protein [Acidimicrobiales bacterium]|nr:phosphatase PAP2 family protein [Acidimicrobiales bacterium]
MPELDRGRPVLRSHWWREVLIVGAFYGLYTLVRDIRGDQPVSVFRAFHNAERIIGFEKNLGIYQERQIQHWFLGNHSFIRFLDDYYGTAHFVAAIAVLLLLFFFFPVHYRLWRNTLALTNVIALLGFSFFPLMPPRLLPSSYHFVDTLRVFGGLWSFSSGPVNELSNQYAAMPSLHTAWALWCAFALAEVIRPWWGKVLVFLHPLITVFCIVVTANHFFADEIAGVLVLGVAYALARMLTLSLDRYYNRKGLAALQAVASTPSTWEAPDERCRPRAGG